MKGKRRRRGRKRREEKRERDIFTAPIYKMAHDQLHSAILREHRKNALYIGGTMRTRRNDAHRTLKYALIILPRRVLMPLALPPAVRSSSTYDTLAPPFGAGESFTQPFYMQKRDKRMQFQRRRSRAIPRFSSFRETYGAKSRVLFLKYFQCRGRREAWDVGGGGRARAGIRGLGTRDREREEEEEVGKREKGGERKPQRTLTNCHLQCNTRSVRTIIQQRDAGTAAVQRKS